MRFFLIVFFGLTTLFGASVVEVEERFQKSQSCKACHLHIVKDWEKSWHAKSHYNSDEYFKATIDYVSRKTRKSLNGVKVGCATCHNPRISVTATDIDYEIMSVMQLDKDSDVNVALQSDAINEGINCVVCHNVDKIHDEADKTKRGINRVEWTKSGTMSGPYDDAKSPYHNVEHRSFMNENSDQLCLVCHANDRAVKGLEFTNMQDEYKKSDKGCTDCHMGPKVMGVAATLRIDHGKARKRKIRAHRFAGGHVSSMWKNVLSLDITQNNASVLISIINPQPHNIPSGFGSRELLVEVVFKKGLQNIGEKAISLTRLYTSKRGKATIPHLAVSATKKVSVPANGKKMIKVGQIKGSTSVEVKLYYRLVNDEVRSILKLKGSKWEKKNFIASKSIKLK